MSKTKWHSKVIYLAIALALTISLAGIAATPPDAAAAPGTTKWTKVSTPQINYSDWEIAWDSTINSFDMGPDGETIYAVGSVGANGPTADPDRDSEIYLWKSTDHGATWSDKTAKIQTHADVVKAEGLTVAFASFNLVSVAPEDADFVAVCGYDAGNNPMVVFSDDGGTHFYYMSALPENQIVYSMDVSTDVGDTHYVAVGSSNSTSNAAVWINKAPGYTGWIDTSLKDGWLEMSGGAVTTVAFSPIFDSDETILAISSNSTGYTWLQSGRWASGSKKWNAAAGDPFKAAVQIKDGEAVGVKTDTSVSCNPTGIAIPSDYDGSSSSLRKVFVYVDGTTATATTTSGYFFRIDSSAIYNPCELEFGGGPDSTGATLFSSVAYHGAGIDGKFMLGVCPAANTDCCVGVQVYRTEEIDICCPEWSGASKKPSGQLRALVAFTPDGKKGYASTRGNGLCDESAFSVSLDGYGQYWNQLSLIDTDIDYLSDVAVNGDCNTTLLFTVNTKAGEELCGCDSVWFKAENLPEATEYNDVWLREWHGLLTGTTMMGLIRLAPEEEERVFTVYLVDKGTKIIRYNASSGLTKWLVKDCTRISDITDLACESESIIYALGGDDVSKSTNNGKKWGATVDTNVTDAHTIAALADGNVLVGSSEDGNRKVAYSSDGAATFSRTAQLSTSTGEGNVHVAFDTYFNVNDTIYAAVDGIGGIHRWVIDESDDWKDLKATPTLDKLDADATAGSALDLSYYGIASELSQDGNPLTDAAHGGVLYATYTYTTGGYYYAGVARCLTPAKTACCTTESWDYLHAKLTVGTTASHRFTLEPSSLRLCGCLTPATNTKLWAIDDQLYNYTGGIGRLWTYEDCFAKEAVTLSSVADGETVASDPCECWNDKFVLEWERLCNACYYDIQISLDKDFNQIISTPTDPRMTWPAASTTSLTESRYGPPTGASPSYVVPSGALDCNTKYWWRVRAYEAETNEVIHSFYSGYLDKYWSFTIEAGPTVAIGLTTPDDGATNVAVTSLGFTWTSVADATSYDFVLSANADLSSPVETKTGLTGTAYTYTGALDYDTTYFWQVTAMKDANVFSESDVSTFSTTPAAVFTCPQCGLTFPTEAALKAHIDEVHAPVVPTTPAWVWIVIGLGAVLVITIIVLIFRTRRV